MPDVRELQQRIDQGEVIILDGAIGSEIERLGAPMHGDVWCAEALDSHPDIVRRVHESYVDAGADVITTNTYSAGRHAMERAGLGDKTAEWTARAARLAVEARDAAGGQRPVYIAGSVSNFGKWGEYDVDKLRVNYRETAQILADGGADLILLEMLAARVEDTIPAVEASLVTGLPVWVGLSCLVDRDTDEVMLGIEESQEHSERSNSFELSPDLDRASLIGHGPFRDAIDKIMAAGGSALLIMHSDLKATQPALGVMKEHYRGTLGAYPNAGYWATPNWAFVDQVTPEEYLAEANAWVEMGAQIVGGCCGLGPDHIRALRSGIAERVS